MYRITIIKFTLNLRESKITIICFRLLKFLKSVSGETKSMFAIICVYVMHLKCAQLRKSHIALLVLKNHDDERRNSMFCTSSNI